MDILNHGDVDSLKEAMHYRKLENNACQCNLCPRNCNIGESQKGFCGTRQNFNGKLYAITFGKSLELTQELIETEAVYFRDPGVSILSVGNLGCNMNCDFCQNWTTSQMKYLKAENITTITKERIIKEALRRKIDILSWTYNDPVVWHEFLYDTAKESKKYGLKNLYKSAFYINEEPVKDLLEVIDIFSISLKAMDEDFYRKHCKTSLEPVLQRIKQVYDANAYLEISNLVVTGRNDNLEHVKRLSDWVLTNLDETVPVHFVAFHPAYRYTETSRTSKDILAESRRVAKEMGLKHVKIGNVFDKDLASSHCINCDELVIERQGLSTELRNVKINDEAFNCGNCGTELSVVKDVNSKFSRKSTVQPILDGFKELTFSWGEENTSVHLRGINKTSSVKHAYYQHKKNDGTLSEFNEISFYSDEEWRFLIERKSVEDVEVLIYFEPEIDLQVMELLDRAYYPVLENPVLEEPPVS